jgi:synaptotagmin-like protein
MISDARAHYDLDITGAIQLKLSYNMHIGSLDIFIIKCTNLAGAKRHQTSNPYVLESKILSYLNKIFLSRYCKIYLLPDRSENSKRKTTVKKSTTEPVFNETLRVCCSHVFLK